MVACKLVFSLLKLFKKSHVLLFKPAIIRKMISCESLFFLLPNLFIKFYFGV
jgi:hypothetical protein